MKKPMGPYPGHPPVPQDERSLKKTYVVFIGRFGWITGRWHKHHPDTLFRDMESGLADHLRSHHKDEISWWMPQSGDMP